MQIQLQRVDNNISIHSLRVEGDSTGGLCRECAAISIHSLRVEGDPAPSGAGGGIAISIHSLRVEGDSGRIRPPLPAADFNPLPPCGGRHNALFCAVQSTDFNPLPPCGGRPNERIVQHPRRSISIHSLRVEGDFVLRQVLVCHGQFQSTPSVWRETKCNCAESRYPDFNPLPPCGGRPHGKITSWTNGDFNPLPPCGGRQSRFRDSTFSKYFNPLPPCGGRPIPATMRRRHLRFQSTPSVWRETAIVDLLIDSLPISIHSLRVEGDDRDLTKLPEC